MKQTPVHAINRVFNERFSKGCMPDVKRIIKEVMADKIEMRDATFHEDTTQATDLVVMQCAGKRMSIRVRQNNYSSYIGQFTIRCWRNGFEHLPQEFDKIFEGWGDWMFYGIADLTTTKIMKWMIIDLDSFRKQIREHGIYSFIDESDVRMNRDQSHGFVAFDHRVFKPTPPILVAKSKDSC